MTAVAPLLPLPSDDEVEEPDVSLLVTEDDAPVDSILTEKQERLLTEPLYSSWSGPPPNDAGVARSPPWPTDSAQRCASCDHSLERQNCPSNN